MAAVIQSRSAAVGLVFGVPQLACRGVAAGQSPLRRRRLPGMGAGHGRTVCN